MLIFLAELAVLIVLLVLGQQAGMHVFHDGGSRYFEHCARCDQRYPRLPGVDRPACPRGHPISSVVAEAHPRNGLGVVVVAVCAGFAMVVIVLALTGVAPLP